MAVFIKETSPIFKGKVDFKNGIRYLGEGGLGVPLRNPEKQNEWYFGRTLWWILSFISFF